MTNIPPEFKRAREYVAMHEWELRMKYGNNYIAVLGDAGVIDFDSKEVELVMRIGRKTHTSINPLVGTIENILCTDHTPTSIPTCESAGRIRR